MSHNITPKIYFQNTSALFRALHCNNTGQPNPRIVPMSISSITLSCYIAGHNVTKGVLVIRYLSRPSLEGWMYPQSWAQSISNLTNGMNCLIDS